jgi:hypothetical protein
VIRTCDCWQLLAATKVSRSRATTTLTPSHTGCVDDPWHHTSSRLDGHTFVRGSAPVADRTELFGLHHVHRPPRTVGLDEHVRRVAELGREDNESFDGLVTPPDGSAAQELARSVPAARVVKAFNTTFAGTLSAGRVADQRLDVFIAGDDEDAKATVAKLAEDGGLNPIDAGPLKRARELEAMGLLHMTLQGSLGTGFSTAVKVLRP